MEKIEDRRLPPPELEECVKCGCVQGVATACDCRDDCACHWTKEVLDAMAADEELAARKEEGI